MRRTAWQFAAFLEIVLCGAAAASTRPHYGGTLRVQLRARVADADPANWPATAWEREAKTRILEQVFEPLVWLDEMGRAQPALAVAWEHDGGFRRWVLTLRSNAVFHDGTPFSAAAAAESLKGAAAGCAATAMGESVSIECERGDPHLLAELALPRNWISRRAADGAPSGTGPFRIAAWEPLKRAALTAYEQHWAGRPFLDGVTFDMGRGAREQMVALDLGRADVAEVSPPDLRRAMQRGAVAWSSPAREAIALEARDSRLREALALAIDRAAIHNVLLGKQGEISGAILPQWISGYAFLFDAERDLARARQIAAGLPKRTAAISYDAADTVARSIAERVAVDAREAGIQAQAAPAADAALRVVRIRIPSNDPVVALAELGATVEPAAALPYAAERDYLESAHLLPLFHVPDLFAVSPQVRAFSWKLADVWLERP
jgi:ABC-type transport system substrate-binding protein